MNLGKGLTEDDPEFSAHLDGKWSNHYPGYLSEGSICSAFEGQGSSRFRPYSLWNAEDK